MFSLIYDISDISFSDFTAMVFCFFFLLIINQIVKMRKKNGANTLTLKGMNIAVFVICFSITIFSWLRFNNLKEISKNGSCNVIEGVVKELTKTSKLSESFVVNNNLFEYHDISSYNGYSNLSWNGGAIQNGVYIKFCHYKGKILKLEIKSQSGISGSLRPIKTFAFSY